MNSSVSYARSAVMGQKRFTVTKILGLTAFAWQTEHVPRVIFLVAKQLRLTVISRGTSTEPRIRTVSKGQIKAFVAETKN